MSVDPDMTKVYADAGNLGYHLESCWCLRATLLWRTCLTVWSTLPPGAMATFKIRLQHRTRFVCGPTTAGRLSVAHVTYVACGLGYNLWSSGYPVAMLPPKPC